MYKLNKLDFIGSLILYDPACPLVRWSVGWLAGQSEVSKQAEVTFPYAPIKALVVNLWIERNIKRLLEQIMELFESLPANSSISHQDCGLQWQTFLTTFVPVTFLADKLMYSILTGDV